MQPTKGVGSVKGVIFDLLRTIVETDHGEDAWDDAIDRAGVDGVYTAVGKYPDDEFTTLLNHVPSGQAASTADLLRWFGRRAMPELAIAYPMFFRGHESLATFLPTLNDVIHAEVRKLYPDAEVPDFRMTGDGEQTLLVEYRSPRRLCALAEGFIVGAADHFDEHVVVEQPTCMLRGDEHCALVCRIAVAAPYG